MIDGNFVIRGRQAYCRNRGREAQPQCSEPGPLHLISKEMENLPTGPQAAPGPVDAQDGTL